MSTLRTTSPSSGPTDLPSLSGTHRIAVEDLETMLATDDDAVDTAVIPALGYREAVEESAVTATGTPATTDGATALVDEDAGTAIVPALVPAPPEAPTQLATAPVGHSLRSRHATPESKAAIRRNLVAVSCVVVSLVVIGVAVGLVGGWIALAVYTMLVVAAAFALRRANARYAPRHSRYTPRHV